MGERDSLMPAKRKPAAKDLLLSVAIKGAVVRDLRLYASHSVKDITGTSSKAQLVHGTAMASNSAARNDSERKGRKRVFGGPSCRCPSHCSIGAGGPASPRFFKCSCRTYRCLAVLPTKRTQIHALIATETSAASFSWAVASLRSLGVVAT